MLKISDIATLLEVTKNHVHYYIRNKHLKATKIDGIYLIEEKDYAIFYEDYFITRNSNKGNKGIASNEQIVHIYDFINDCMNDDIDYKTFSKKYKHINKILPPLDKFVLAIRNKHILKDLETMKQAEVSAKYNLSLDTIKKISSKSKERSN